MAIQNKKSVFVPQINIQMHNIIIGQFFDELQDILKHGHTHYANAGGRGSTKSSLFSVAIPLLIINYPLLSLIIIIIFIIFFLFL